MTICRPPFFQPLSMLSPISPLLPSTLAADSPIGKLANGLLLQFYTIV